MNDNMVCDNHKNSPVVISHECIGCELDYLNDRYKFCVSVINDVLNSLPNRRDWLNPETEVAMRKIINEV